MTTQLEFIQKVAPHAVNAMHEHRVLASLTIAQACLESGYGKASIGNNIFGIKAGGGWTGKTQTVVTHEYYNGVKTKVNAVFRDYNSISDSIKDHTSLFVRLQRYQNLLGETDYRRASQLVYQDGYATDPNYPAKLISIIEQYKLYQYDKEVKEASKLSQADQKIRQLLMERGITDGKEAEKFIEVWKMLTKAMKFDVSEELSKDFDDGWAKAKEYGITSGGRPREYATREEVAVMCVRAVDYILKKGK